MADSEKFIEGVKKQKIEQRIAHYNEILQSDMYTKESPEYIKAKDVIDEIVSLLEKSDSTRSFVESSVIEKRIEEYFKKLEYIDEEYLKSKKAKLEGELGDPSSSSDEPKPRTLEEIYADIDELMKLEVVAPTPEEIQRWKDSRPKNKKDKQEELEAIEKALRDLEGRDDSDIEEQKRVTKNRIEELQDIAKEKELFKINEKGEVTIEYPDIVPELDEQAIRDEYAFRRADMINKFYGNREMERRYSDIIDTLVDNVEYKEFEYIDEQGRKQKGEYRTIAPYEGMEEDLKFAQLEELVERLERMSKYEAGDKSVYNEVYARDEAGKIVKLSPEKAREADEEYVLSNNGAYNRLVYTAENLKTLGKYGEKVPYNKFQQGQPVRNVLRAVGNAGKFVRNHVTAPINRLIGKVVSPTYALLSGANNQEVAGLYSNKLSHRYVARREYYQSQGQGFFRSRFNSIFHAKEGNEAILNAGVHDIQESLRRKYTDIGRQEVMRKKTEFASKSIAEKIKIIETDMEATQDDKEKAKFQATLDDLRKAQAQIERDRAINEMASINQTRQTDAISEATHDVANKENVTRTITGFKVATRLGFAKLVGPKIKEWLLGHTTKTEQVPVPATDEQIREALDVPTEKWVPTTYKNIETDVLETRLRGDASMSDIMGSNASRTVEGYYSVYGGEAKPAMYSLTGDEKITAIFQSTGNTGTGLSDVAGLKAPVLTDGTFAKELLDANGVLRQDVTLDKILQALGTNAVKPEDLSDLYVSVGDRYWTKLSDLCKGLTEQVKTGTDITSVVDVAGHYQALTSAELETAVKQALDAKLATDPNFLESLSTTVPQVAENTRVTSVLTKLGIPFSVALYGDDAYENLRKTFPDPETTQKPGPRHTDKKAGFTGSRKQDLKNAREEMRKAEDRER